MLVLAYGDDMALTWRGKITWCGSGTEIEGVFIAKAAAVLLAGRYVEARKGRTGAVDTFEPYTMDT
jgi:hypothetical protein